ncbi:hypothetical protein [Alteribacter aurantiacus]|uniref:hypothetical protein n=1 Tax=Alteribacter aurantiacus TaxID=254410 RepID=UPI0004099C04|nr:hypothetical protein [Alteribacter aurantiacus]
MGLSLEESIKSFVKAWESSELSELVSFISPDYQAREITGGEIVDFGYDKCIKGWEDGFQFVEDNQAQWDVRVIKITPIRDDEAIVTITASLLMNDEYFKGANLFYETFKKNTDREWKVVRSYIEAGLPVQYILDIVEKRS